MNRREFIKSTLISIAATAIAVNIKIPKAASRYISAIKRSTSLMIDNPAPVCIRDANRRYADMIGKKVVNLNENERLLALANETIRCAERYCYD
jgi:hypothetical protein